MNNGKIGRVANRNDESSTTRTRNIKLHVDVTSARKCSRKCNITINKFRMCNRVSYIYRQINSTIKTTISSESKKMCNRAIILRLRVSLIVSLCSPMMVR